MKTISTLRKKLSIILFPAVLLLLNTNAKAQCTASFVAYDSLGYVYFNNQSSGMGTGITSSWSFGDGSFGTSTGDITHYYTTSGIYYVCLTISNFLGTCNDTYCDTLYINTTPGGGSGMCLGVVNPYFTATDSLTYGVFSNTPTGTGVVYHWDFGDGSTSNVVGSTTHNYSSNGTYLVCLNVYETGGSYDSCAYCNYITIGGGSAGPCDASFTIVQDSSNQFNYFIYLNNPSSTTLSYFWNFGDGTSSTLQYPSHTYPSSGPYYICLTIADSVPALGLCTATYCDSLEAGRTSTPITINVIPAGITNLANSINTFENYPNPFSDNTTITYTLSKQENVELCVFDLLGNKVSSIESGNKNAGSHTVVWNAESLNQGMYLLQLKAGGNSSTKKIIINK